MSNDLRWLAFASASIGCALCQMQRRARRMKAGHMEAMHVRRSSQPRDVAKLRAKQHKRAGVSN